MHRYHPDIKAGDDPEAILYDECEDCDSRTERPAFYLDHDHINRLWQRMIDVELEDKDSYRSVNEKLACQTLWHTYILLERHTNNPNPRYLNFK